MKRPDWQPRFYLMERNAYGRTVYAVIDSGDVDATLRHERVVARCDARVDAGRIAGLLNREEECA